eukprot:symbB.v1.2.038919.t1/scaffold6231.1/size19816/3
MIAITVYREVVPRPLPRPVVLRQSLLRMSYVSQVFGMVVQATDLPNREMIGAGDLSHCRDPKLPEASLERGLPGFLFRTRSAVASPL